MTLFRYTTVPALMVTTVLALGACSDSDSDGGGATTGDGAGDNQASLAELYTGALDGLNVADFRDPEVTAGELTGEFEYAVADLNADQSEELLVKANGTEFSAIRIYGAAEGNAELVKTSKIFHDGAAGAGGTRMNVMTTSDSNGLLNTSFLSGTGEAKTTLWAFDGSDMTKSDQTWEYRIDRTPSDLESSQRAIDWTPADDLTGLDALGEGTSEDEDGSGEGPEPTTAGDAGDTGNSGASASSGGTLPQTATAPSEQIGGDCGTVDGATVTAGGSTSCGFAMAVAQEALQPVYGRDTISPADANGYAGIATVTATSPTNGQTYTMQCGIGSAAGTSTCTGGNNASVSVTKPGNGSLLYLVD
jgi:hypothetical protein